MSDLEQILKMFPMKDKKKNLFEVGTLGKLWVTFVANGQKVPIGRLKDERGRLVYVKEVKPKNLYRDRNSWNIASHLIPILATYNALIRCVSPSLIYEIDAVQAMIFEEVQWRYYEPQLAIPISRWKTRE